MSKKRKLKKALRNAALLGAVGLGAAALGKKRRQANEMKDFLATEGGNLSILPSAKRMMNIAGKMAAPVDVNANPRYNTQVANRRGAMGGGVMRKAMRGGGMSTARKDMRSGYYPSDMGMAGGAMNGGRMKKMGGGMAKRKMLKAGSNGNGKGKVPNKLKGFSKLPEKVQMKINKKLAKKV